MVGLVSMYTIYIPPPMIYEWLLKQGALYYQKRYIMSLEVKLGKTGYKKTCLTKPCLLWTYKKVTHRVWSKKNAQAEFKKN